MWLTKSDFKKLKNYSCLWLKKRIYFLTQIKLKEPVACALVNKKQLLYKIINLINVKIKKSFYKYLCETFLFLNGYCNINWVICPKPSQFIHSQSLKKRLIV